MSLTLPSYKSGLKNLGLETLEKRRDQMCMKFAKQCLKLEKMKKFFVKNESAHSMLKRDSNSFKVVHCTRYNVDTNKISF